MDGLCNPITTLSHESCLTSYFWQQCFSGYPEAQRHPHGLPSSSSLPRMASTSKNKKSLPSDRDAEERTGLLNPSHDNLHEEAHDIDELDTKPGTWSRKKLTTTAILLIGLLVTGTFARTVLWSKPDRKQRAASLSGGLYSNGTHDYRRTVLIVSIDGLRYAISTVWIVLSHA